MERHVFVLSSEIGERNLVNYHSLNRASTYITNVMSESSFNITSHDYHYKRHLLQNIVAEKRGQELPDQIIIIGAHYDTVVNSPGADDNSSGIAGLLELTRLLADYESKRTIRIVAFTLEEPPFHDSPFMGSTVYAKRCHDRKENVIGMVSLEMIGFYTSKSNSQRYPRPDMEYRYPDRGDFIAIIGNHESRELVHTTSECIKLNSRMNVLPFVAVHGMPGITLSDHAPFWKQGVKAIMITDTAFFRNPHYHNPDDTYDTLDYRICAEFLYGFAHAVKKIDSVGLDNIESYTDNQ
ncbi:M28 family peptidase [candidate division KSB1 bacterium]|nr:M28 family peptidase [candidate division KSB1 bacterium]